jgi:hypothetical protein
MDKKLKTKFKAKFSYSTLLFAKNYDYNPVIKTCCFFTIIGVQKVIGFYVDSAMGISTICL